MTKKQNLVPEAQFVDQQFQGGSFRSFVDDPAEKIQAVTAQSRTGLDKKPVVLHGLETSH